MNLNNIQAVHYYLIEIDNSYDGVLKKKYGTFEYIRPDTMDQDKYVFPQVGRIVDVPRKNSLGLQKGDMVIVHHLIYDNLIEGKLYWEEEHNLIGKIIGEQIEMLNNRVMIEKVVSEEKIGSIFLPKKESNVECYVKAVSKNSHLKEGQKIGIIEDSFYSFDIDGKRYYTVDEAKQVMFYFDDNEQMQPIQSFVMVAGDDMNEVIDLNGIQLPRRKVIEEKTRWPVGEVYRTHPDFEYYVPNRFMTDVVPQEGDKVYFDARNDRYREEGGQSFYFCRVEEYEEIKLVLN